MRDKKIKYGILASGALGELCVEHIFKASKINFVFTDKNSNSIIIFCEKNNIPVFIGNPRLGRAIDFMNNFKTDVIFSINYLFIVEKDIIDHPNKISINFHGSLLPKYRGRTPHVWAIINNEKVTGITAHRMTESCDEGEIIFQEKIEIAENDTGATILSKFNQRYPFIIDEVMKMISSDKIYFQKQDETKATWFGKRTPEDGEIKWHWQKERIHNWVRAQAKPYPGAFTYYQNSKIVIHKIEFSDFGFMDNERNGTIIFSDGEIIIKTPNGAVKLIEFEYSDNIKLIKGNYFHERH